MKLQTDLEVLLSEEFRTVLNCMTARSFNFFSLMEVPYEAATLRQRHLQRSIKENFLCGSLPL